jgi:hypothetical protein
MKTSFVDQGEFTAWNFFWFHIWPSRSVKIIFDGSHDNNDSRGTLPDGIDEDSSYYYFPKPPPILQTLSQTLSRTGMNDWPPPPIIIIAAGGGVTLLRDLDDVDWLSRLHQDIKKSACVFL